MYGTTLEIKLRQPNSSTHPFVTFHEIEGATEVLLDALTEPLALGEYEIVLESYNSLSEDEKTLMTDTIIVKVVDQCTYFPWDTVDLDALFAT